MLINPRWCPGPQADTFWIEKPYRDKPPPLEVVNQEKRNGYTRQDELGADTSSLRSNPAATLVV